MDRRAIVKSWHRASADSGSVAGRWEGEWISTATGHRGPLRCVIDGTAGDRWHACFRAGYARVFRACYATELQVAGLPQGGWTFRGRSDLGALGGGQYEYAGEASADAFTCRYKSRHDHGEFRLKRVL